MRIPLYYQVALLPTRDGIVVQAFDTTAKSLLNSFGLKGQRMDVGEGYVLTQWVIDDEDLLLDLLGKLCDGEGFGYLQKAMAHCFISNVYKTLDCATWRAKIRAALRGRECEAGR